jgi:hypothetical protein
MCMPLLCPLPKVCRVPAVASWGNRIKDLEGEWQLTCNPFMEATFLQFHKSTAPGLVEWVKSYLASVNSNLVPAPSLAPHKKALFLQAWAWRKNWFPISSQCCPTFHLFYWKKKICTFHQNIAQQLREVISLEEQSKQKKTEAPRLRDLRFPTSNLFIKLRQWKELEIRSDESSKHRGHLTMQQESECVAVIQISSCYSIVKDLYFLISVLCGLQFR